MQSRPAAGRAVARGTQDGGAKGDRAFSASTCLPAGKAGRCGGGSPHGLKRRYAAGEIGKEEFESMKKDLL